MTDLETISEGRTDIRVDEGDHERFSHYVPKDKLTSLAAAITVPEMFQAAQRIVATTYEPLILYVEAAILYLAMSSVLSALQTRLETRLNRYGGFLEARS